MAMTRFVSAAEANRQFSELLGQAASGEIVVITRRGQPVAQLVPFDQRLQDESHDAAWSRLMKTIEKGMDLGGGTFDRDSLYER
jgi:prevent-host-death family protein